MSAAATLKALLGLDTGQYKAGMRDATGATGTFQQKLASVGRIIGAAFSVGAVVSMGRALTKWASDASQAAQNAGVLTEEMIALNRVGLANGADLGDMAKLLSKVQNELFSAAGGSEQSAKKFEQLGLSVADLIKLNPTDQLRAVAQAAFATATPLQMLSDLFGDKLGPKIVSSLREIAETGLPTIDSALGGTADEVSALGDKWDVLIDKAKEYAAVGFGRASRAFGDVAAFARGYAQAEPDEGNRLGFMESVRLKLRAGRQAVQERTERDAVEAAKAKARREQTRTQSAQELSIMLEDEAWRKAFEEQKKRDEKTDAANVRIKEMSKDAQERIERLSERASSFSARTSGDQMARVGGFVGASRGGLGIADRQLEEAKRLREIQQESRRILDNLQRDIQRIADTVDKEP